MEELFSYRLSDFLLFSEQTYWRIFSRYNHSIFPLPIISLLFGLYYLYAFVSRKKISLPILLVIFALAWSWIGYRFFWQLYSEINAYARYLGIFFFCQGLLLLFRSSRPALPSPLKNHRKGVILGALLWLIALLVLPLIEILLGKSIGEVSSFALTPDSIAIASMSLIFIFKINAWWLLVAAGWLLVSALTYLAMESWLFLLPTMVLFLYTGKLIQREEKDFAPSKR